VRGNRRQDNIDSKSTDRKQPDLHCDLGLFQMTIHGRVHSHNGPLNDRPILQLDGHLLSVQFLQELDQLHAVAAVAVAAQR
jgi:hypothetical protein